MQTMRVGGASYAAALTAAALHSGDSFPDVLRQVDSHLYQLGPELVVAARPSACEIVAEVTMLGGALTVHAWAGGDTQIWVCTEAGWGMLVGVLRRRPGRHHRVWWCLASCAG